MLAGYVSRMELGEPRFFEKKAGFPQMFAAASLDLRQAAGQGFGVGEEGLDRRTS
jgi:hypothetical protein